MLENDLIFYSLEVSSVEGHKQGNMGRCVLWINRTSVSQAVNVVPFKGTIFFLIVFYFPHKRKTVFYYSLFNMLLLLFSFSFLLS